MITLTKERPLLQQHFAFAHGRIGAILQNLLTQSDIDRLLGAPDFQETERLLTELKWTTAIDKNRTQAPYILDALRQWLYQEIAMIVPASKQRTFDILWLDEDVPHLSYLLKKFHGLTSNPDPSSSICPIKFHLNNTPSPLFDRIRTIQKWNAPLASHIDTAMTHEVTKTKLLLAKKSGSHRIVAFVVHTIDLQNIRTAVRIILRKGLIDATDHQWFLSGGSLPVSAFNGDLKHLRQKINSSPLAFTLTEEHLDFADDPGSFERSLSYVTARDITEMWNIPLSIDPVFAFAALVLLHLRVLRVLLMGKRNVLSPQEIKTLLPPFIPFSHYVVA